MLNFSISPFNLLIFFTFILSATKELSIKDLLEKLNTLHHKTVISVLNTIYSRHWKIRTSFMISPNQILLCVQHVTCFRGEFELKTFFLIFNQFQMINFQNSTFYKSLSWFQFIYLFLHNPHPLPHSKSTPKQLSTAFHSPKSPPKLH